MSISKKPSIIKYIKDNFSQKINKIFTREKFSLNLLDHPPTNTNKINSFLEEKFIHLDKLDKKKINLFKLELNRILNSKNLNIGSDKSVYKQLHQSTSFNIDSEMLKFALDEKILNILINYFKTRCILYDVRVIESYSNDDLIQRDQLWHRDKYDTKSVRLWVKLSETSKDDGPTMIIPYKYSKKMIKTHFMRVDDAYISKHLDNKKIISLTGNKGDVSLIDVHKLVHCGSRIRKGRKRYVFNAIYTSSKPWMRPTFNENLRKKLLMSKNLSFLQKSFLRYN